MEYRELSEQLSFGGQPTEDELRELAKKGVKTVVNVRDSAEEVVHLSTEQEKALAESLGMTYVHVPVTGKNIGEETAAEVTKAIAAAKKDGSVFVH